MRGAEIPVGVAESAHHVLFEPRRHLERRHERSDFLAPRIVLERLGSGGQRGARAGRYGAREYDAASEQRTAIEQPIAGNRLERRSLAALANGHGVFLPGERRRDAPLLSLARMEPTRRLLLEGRMLLVFKAAAEPTSRWMTRERLASFANRLQQMGQCN
jgi:hypothetical protein